jgi:hypothetical protein
VKKATTRANALVNGLEGTSAPAGHRHRNASTALLGVIGLTWTTLEATTAFIATNARLLRRALSSRP